MSLGIPLSVSLYDVGIIGVCLHAHVGAGNLDLVPLHSKLLGPLSRSQLGVNVKFLCVILRVHRWFSGAHHGPQSS